MKPHLKVTLLPGWEDISHENPDGPPTYVRSGDQATGVLQISIQVAHDKGPEPNPTYVDLIQLSEHVANIQEAEVTERYWGDCNLGRFGCVIGKTAELPRIQIWTLTNGRDFVLATFLCQENPDSEETAQAATIVKSVALHWNTGREKGAQA